ncbi:MAG: hypothetical protein JOY86_04575 [Candidatus Eremiobacteraeota bacterium]|nr:hypothetical protein [Candidatus Eremiobacteraeota bacterium]
MGQRTEGKLMRWPSTLAVVFAVLATAALAAQASAACVVTQGDHVVLASQGLDPDVFVWDSARRLTAYLEGDYDTETVLHHTVLAQPGTKAVAVGCKEGAGHPKYAKTTLDLVGVKLTDGPSKGHYGWVVADDVRRPDGRPVTPPTP